jgi:hypothetical protein
MGPPSSDTSPPQPRPTAIPVSFAPRASSRGVDCVHDSRTAPKPADGAPLHMRSAALHQLSDPAARQLIDTHRPPAALPPDPPIQAPPKRRGGGEGALDVAPARGGPLTTSPARGRRGDSPANSPGRMNGPPLRRRALLTSGGRRLSRATPAQPRPPDSASFAGGPGRPYGRPHKCRTFPSGISTRPFPHYRPSADPQPFAKPGFPELTLLKRPKATPGSASNRIRRVRNANGPPATDPPSCRLPRIPHPPYPLRGPKNGGLPVPRRHPPTFPSSLLRRRGKFFRR